MIIWIDADACPRLAREIVFKAAERLKLPVGYDRSPVTVDESLSPKIFVDSLKTLCRFEKFRFLLGAPGASESIEVMICGRPFALVDTCRFSHQA